jgi:hypothetical protein
MPLREITIAAEAYLAEHRAELFQQTYEGGGKPSAARAI